MRNTTNNPDYEFHENVSSSRRHSKLLYPTIHLILDNSKSPEVC